MLLNEEPDKISFVQSPLLYTYSINSYGKQTCIFIVDHFSLSFVQKENNSLKLNEKHQSYVTVKESKNLLLPVALRSNIVCTCMWLMPLFIAKILLFPRERH